MQQTTINDLYETYLSGDLSRKNFMGLIYHFLVNNQEKTGLCHWKQNEYEDYVSWFYPRLDKVINSYSDVGASFESYINKFILVSAKEYKVRLKTNEITEYSTWSARIPDMYLYEQPPVYVHDFPHSYAESEFEKFMNDYSGRKNTKRILALILKCYYFISVDFADKIAARTGINNEELYAMLEKIRIMRQEKDDDIYNLKERIYCQFYRCLVYEKRMSLAKEHINVYKKLESRLIKARQRLEKMRERLSKKRTYATNQQIAEVIGTTKGTVDSSLYQLKSKWEEMSKKAPLN